MRWKGRWFQPGFDFTGGSGRRPKLMSFKGSGLQTLLKHLERPPGVFGSVLLALRSRAPF